MRVTFGIAIGTMMLWLGLQDIVAVYYGEVGQAVMTVIMAIVILSIEYIEGRDDD